ncbi:MAG: VPLPA-CTERM sorting domain-containing protein, partial [Proteobacteria bacterium]|nr:VPLPA-CTERM sorting domain-containing protein [Burkholderiales bacterium]
LLDTAPLGFFTQSVLLSGFSFNGVGLDLPANATLVLTGLIVDGTGTTVIPLPAAGWLLLTGLGVFGMLGRRRATARV